MSPVVPTLPPEGTTGGVRELSPKVYYLRDKDGQLVLVPDFSFERYEQLVAREVAQNAPRPPAYSFADLVELRGKSAGQQAELTVVVPLRLVSGGDAASGWVRIPLRLNQAVLTAVPEFTGSGQMFLEYRPDDDGYVAWVQSKSDSVQQLTLQVKMPLARAGGEYQLQLAMVRTPMRLSLELAAADVEGHVGASDENILTIQRPDAQRTVLLVDGTGGNLELAWQEKNAQPSLMEATGSVLVTVGADRVECNAKLKVRGYGSPIDSFTVRLPPGMDLVALSQPGLRLSTVNNAAEQGEAGQQVLVKRLEGRTSEAIDVQLVAWRPPQSSAQRALLEVGGFEVLGAVRQWGTYDIVTDGEWQTDFTTGPNLQRLEDSSGTPSSAGGVARFEYYRQPCSLQIELTPKRTQLSLDPAYVFHTEPDRVRLEATLRYQVNGTRPRAVQIDLRGWSVDRVTPAEFVVQPLSLDNVAPLRIALSPSALAGTGSFELRVEAHQPLDNRQPLTLTPLRCPETTATPALVVIAPADNTEVIPDPDATVGLITDQLPASVNVASSQQAPLVFREEPASDRPVFVARVRKRDQAISVQVSTTAVGDSRQLNVTQVFSYQVSFEPMRQLVLESPVPLASLARLQITAGGQAAKWVAEEPGAAGAAARIRAELPQPGMGRCDFTVSYGVAVTGLKLNEQRSWRLPLLQPAADPRVMVSRNTLEASGADNLEVEMADEQWSLETTPSANASTSAVERFVAEGSRSAVSLGITLIQPRPQPSTFVHRAWLQVWLARQERRDRAVFQLTTEREQLEIRLPTHAHTSGVEVWVSGRPVRNFRVTSNRGVQLALEKTAGPRQVTVELYYWFSLIDPPIGRLTIEPPDLPAARRADRFYWQLVLPDHEYILWSPDTVTRETVWRWQGWGFARVANLNQSDLEAWTGSSRQQPLPAFTNQYLFSSIGTMAPCVFVSAKRSLVLLAFSGVVLAISLLLLYLPVLRHAGMWIVVTVVVATVGAIYPDPAVVAVQAAALGIALVPLARLLRWAFSRNRQLRASARAAAPGKSGSRAEELPVRAGDGSSRTGSAPLPRPEPVESQT